jgi:hypothetical protein
VAQQKKPDLIFDRGKFTHEQWKLSEKECRFEAAKAVIPVKPAFIANEQFNKILILCLEAKGMTFRGTEDELK